MVHEQSDKYSYLVITDNKGDFRLDISPNEGKRLEKIQPHHQNKVGISDFHRFIYEC